MARGYPDYTKGAAPQRTVIGAGQARFNLTVHGALPGAAITTVAIYLVPAGFQLNIISGIASKARSMIMRFQLLDDAAIFFDAYKDVLMINNPAESGGYTMAAGHVLSAVAYNDDVLPVNFSATIMGTLEQV
jgi:hypothetical protein